MFKRIAGSTLAAALTLSISAKDKDHVVDFNEVKEEASGRNARHLVSTAKDGKETFVYLYGKTQLVDNQSGKSLDFSDGRSRTEFRLKTGSYYDVNNGTISFDLAPLKAGFGVKGEAVIFEEANEDTAFGLYLDKAGRLRLKVSARFDLKKESTDEEVVYDEKYFANLDNPKIKFENKNALDDAVDNKKATEDAAAAAALEVAKPKYEVKEYSFHSFQLGDSKNWTPGEWQKISVSWDLRRGFFVVYVNGRYAIRAFASETGGLGTFLSRGNAGAYIKFGAGNNGMSAMIDNIRIGKAVVDQEDRKN
jgi:hypothetical protein